LLGWVISRTLTFGNQFLIDEGKEMSIKSLPPMASIAILAAAVAADAQPRQVQVGTLSCSVSAGIGLIVASQRNVNCNFQPDNGPPEAYTHQMTAEVVNDL
jgi:Protein of unknown function (DUF992)